jgi:hypothetical protein
MLKELYNTHKNELESVREALPNETLHGPFLMHLDEYYKQPIKLFVIGQETGGWCFDYKNHAELLKNYKDFEIGKNYKSTPFFNITRKLEQLIGIAPYSTAWSNLNRYDHNGGEPKGAVLEEIKKLDLLVKKEVETINPDICMFYTNRKYDSRLKDLYPGIIFEAIDGLPNNHFTRLIHPELPEYSYRTPHPKTIRIEKWEHDFINTMNTILPKNPKA